jgi:hypothetical protein
MQVSRGCSSMAPLQTWRSPEPAVRTLSSYSVSSSPSPPFWQAQRQNTYGWF